MGGIDSKGKACDNRTDLQKTALVNLLANLKLKYPNAHIMGHRDIWGKNPSNWKKQCPCFDAEAEYSNIGKPKVSYKTDCVTDYTTKYIDSVLDLKPWK